MLADEAARDRLSGADQGARPAAAARACAASSEPRRFRGSARSAQREATSAFGDDRVLIESYIDAAAPYRGAGVRATHTAMRCTSSSAIARCSAATRR